MRSRQLTLTTVGLPVRTELRLRSLMELIKSKTTDEWSFVEHSGADVALCNPASALSAVTMRRSSSSGTHCVSVVEDPALAAAATSIIREPIRASDLIDLLNRVSAEKACGTVLQAAAPAGATHTDQPALYPMALALRTLTLSGSQSLHCLRAESIELHVIPSSHTALMGSPLSEADCQRIAAHGISIESRELPVGAAQALLDAGSASCKLDTLLWRLGLNGDNSQLLPELRAHGAFKLRRWPDFGRLGHTADHLRLAARMVRRESTVDEIATSVGVSAQSVHAFINACALCGLLEALPSTRDTPPAIARPPIEGSAPRYASLFKTIRSVLGFGASA